MLINTGVIMLIRPEDKILKEINTDTVEAIHKNVSTFDSVMQLVGLLLILCFILVAAYYTSKFVGKAKINQYKNSNFKVIDSYKISQNKVLQLIQVGTKYIVISICKDTINVMMELEESEVLITEPLADKKVNFKEILEKFKNK